MTPERSGGVATKPGPVAPPGLAPEIRRKHGSRRRHSQRLLLTIALTVSLTMLVGVSLYASMRIDALLDENSRLEAELARAKREIARLSPALEAARRSLAEITRGRLPHLLPLIPDKVIAVNNAYVKNIVFTVLKNRGQTRYEYRVVVENGSEGLLRPDARVFVFDHRGVQVGSGEVRDRNDLLPGESRTYSSLIERFIDEEPRYFYVWVRDR